MGRPPIFAGGRPVALGDASATRVEELSDKRGAIRLWQCTPHIYASRVEGHLSLALAQLIISYVEPMFARGRVLGFHDWFGMSGYDSASRSELTSWSMRHRAETQINIGSTNRLVSMGVTVASLALGQDVLRHFSEERALEDAFRSAMLAEKRGG